MAHQNPAIQKLLEDRYYLRNSKGELLETEPSQMFGRVAKAVAKAELNYTDNPMIVDRYRVQFYELMNNNKFLPNTPLLINAGKENPGCYSACFTVPVEDSMEGIFEAVKRAAIISKAGGGVGFNFSNIRAKGSIVKSTGHAASGPVSFMRVFNTMCDTVSQGGVRRGAMIAELIVSHPDILEFIQCKDDGVSFTNFNISVIITNDFMKAVEGKQEWPLVSTDGKITSTVNAEELWNEICSHAWKTGEPGLIFIDRMREDDPEVRGTNPCLVGNTRISTLGGAVEIKDLVGKTPLLYCTDTNKNVFIRQANKVWSNGIKKTVRVELDNGEYLVCTPDHKLLLNNGTYVAAGELKFGDSLAAFHRTVDKNEPAWNKGLTGEEYTEHYTNGFANQYSNHKVVRVIDCGEEEVFDISVPDFNNFVANGVFVHNCGEIPLRNFESCTLASINLLAYVKENISTKHDKICYCGEKADFWFDFDALKKDIPTMVRFLDDVIDVNHFPLPEIDEATKYTRKIGLGIMGWADLLIKLSIPYDSDYAINLAHQIMKLLKTEAAKASIDLGLEKGLPKVSLDEDYGNGCRRNYTLLCVAPTGTISRIAQCSSGIEPVFAWKTHHKLVDLEYDEEHWAYKEFRDNVANDGLMLPDYMKTARDVSGQWHLAHQAIFQEYIDNSVSKTVNLPPQATVEEVAEIYMAAWEQGCKGITVYRDGSRTDQPLNDTNLEKRETEDSSKQLIPEDFESVAQFRERGQVAVGLTYKLDTTKGKMYITVNYGQDQTEPVEVFVRLGASATAREHELAEWCGRLLSTCLKYNVPIEKLVRQGSKVFSDISFIYNHRFFNSIPQLIGYLLEVPFSEAVGFAGLELSDGPIAWEPEFQLDPPTEQVYEGEYCYNCGQPAMIMSGGCKVCTNCGYEKCG